MKQRLEHREHQSERSLDLNIDCTNFARINRNRKISLILYKKNIFRFLIASLVSE